MSLHIVSRVNSSYKMGTWFECMDDGCRQVEIETVNNRVKVRKEVGFILPFDHIKTYVTTIMKRGIRRHDEQTPTAG